MSQMLAAYSYTCNYIPYLFHGGMRQNSGRYCVLRVRISGKELEKTENQHTVPFICTKIQ